MDTADLKAGAPARSVDARGQVCPYPLIQTKNGLKEIRDGEILEVLTDAEMSATETIPALCQKLGYPIDIAADGPAWRIRIRKGA